MYCWLKQGQITPNVENKYVLKLIHFVAQCSKITNTVLFLKRILHHFSVSCCFLLVMSECPKVHFVALRFILLWHLTIQASHCCVWCGFEEKKDENFIRKALMFFFLFLLKS